MKNWPMLISNRDMLVFLGQEVNLEQSEPRYESVVWHYDPQRLWFSFWFIVWAVRFKSSSHPSLCVFQGKSGTPGGMGAPGPLVGDTHSKRTTRAFNTDPVHQILSLLVFPFRDQRGCREREAELDRLVLWWEDETSSFVGINWCKNVKWFFRAERFSFSSSFRENVAQRVTLAKQVLR